MTITKRYLTEMKDVLAIRLVCQCGASVSIPPKPQWHIPEMCPNCKTYWLPSNSVDYSLVEYLLRNVIALGERNEKAACRVQLEFDVHES